MGMLEKKTTEFLEALSSKEPVPGGGGASAAVGAFGAALGMMVANLTVGKKKYRDVEEKVTEAREKLRNLRDQLVRLVDEDAVAFEPLAKAYALPQGTIEEQKEKERIMEQALHDAAVAPLRIMTTIGETMPYIQFLAEKGSRLAVSDAGIGILFAQAALEAASFNVYINTKLMKDREMAKKLNKEADEQIQRGARIKEAVYEYVLGQMK